MSNPNIEVQSLGQSFWYDNIQRELIASGEIKTLIDQFGVLGITSNPSIFEKAITGSGDYDADILRLVESGADNKSLYETLAIADIQAAADVLEPVYEQTNGIDGYISLEVSPDLAHNTDGTVEEARRLYAEVGRKNLMVKVPATPAGIPAIQQLISDGININVTLIFSLDSYEAVARAYLAGLQTRATQGLPVNVASVASFFVSRVDVLVDKLLDEKITALDGANEDAKAHLQTLKGKAAIANAKLAYAAFGRIFGEPQFQSLREQGARPQRVLWASTSTKNPAYKDTYYAEALIGPDTVDTLPPATLKAFADHGVVARTLDVGFDEAQRTLDELATAGISMPEVWQRLQDDGVKLFSDAFASLMKGVDNKRKAIASRGVASNVDNALGYIDELIKLKAAKRIWARDAALWSDQPEHVKVIKNRLGWLQVAEQMLSKVAELNSYRDEVVAKGLTDVVVLGMGGSSLAPDVLRATLGPSATGLRLHVLDTTDPTTVLQLEHQLNLTKTLFVVASKSGGTLEVNAFYKYFRAKVDMLDHDGAGAHFIAITDEGTGLQTMAASEGFGKVFVNPSDIGGRYSALSYFGLVPAALAGFDIETLLKRATQMAMWCQGDSAVNPGLWLGGLMGGMALAGRDKVSFIISPQIHAFGFWVEQLIAESTGKQDRGIVPIEGDLADVNGPMKVTAAELGEDRFYIYMKVANDESEETAANDKFVSSLKKAGAPIIELTLNDVYDLGAEFFRWEYATAVAGAVIGVDPFDEPNVTESKQNTRRLLDEYEGSGVFSSELTSKSPNGQINKLARMVKPGDYVSIQAYLPYSAEVDEALDKMRVMLRDRTGTPVTVGYGPRFLHSTGQLHKGGANNVVAVLLTYEPEDEALIPGEPFSFATLIRGQALGDFESLKAHGRRAIRLHLGNDVSAGFRKVLKVLSNGAKRARGRAGARRTASATKTTKAKSTSTTKTPRKTAANTAASAAGVKKK